MSCNGTCKGSKPKVARDWLHMKNKALSNGYKPGARPLTIIRIRARAGNSRQGWLTASGLTIPVALGRGGILANKREGDGGTPRGTFFPRKLWWRADRAPRPRTFLASRTITPRDAWCEDPDDRHYNQPIRVARDHKGDRLKREDHLYD